MNSIKTFFKKYWLFIVLALIAGALISLYFINKIREDEIREDLILIPTPKIERFSIKTPLSYSGLQKEKINVKEEIVYEIKPSLLSDKEAISIAQKFNFKTIPEVYQDQENNNIFYEWSEVDKYLSINLLTGEIEYQKEDLKSVSQEKDISIDSKQAEKIARSFLENHQLLPPEDINLILSSKQYLQINEVHFSKVDSLKEAHLLQLNFQYQINEKSLSRAFINILLDKNNNIFRLIFKPSFKEIKNIAFYPLKTKKDILKELKVVNFIHYLSKPDYPVTQDEVKNLSTINLNKIEVVYLKTNQKENYLIPLFFISGKGLLKDGEILEVGLYLPAIKDEYLLTP